MVRRELKFGFGLHQQTKQKKTSMKLRREEDDVSLRRWVENAGKKSIFEGQGRDF